MDNKDFITVSLNLKSERIRSLKTVHKNGRLYIYISLIPEYWYYVKISDKLNRDF